MFDCIDAWLFQTVRIDSHSYQGKRRCRSKKCPHCPAGTKVSAIVFAWRIVAQLQLNSTVKRQIEWPHSDITVAFT